MGSNPTASAKIWNAARMVIGTAWKAVGRFGGIEVRPLGIPPNHENSMNSTVQHRWFPGDQHMIVCKICGNKRCPRALSVAYRCTNSNDIGQWGRFNPVSTKPHIKIIRDRWVCVIGEAYGEGNSPTEAFLTFRLKHIKQYSN